MLEYTLNWLTIEQHLFDIHSYSIINITVSNGWFTLAKNGRNPRKFFHMLLIKFRYCNCGQNIRKNCISFLDNFNQQSFHKQWNRKINKKKTNVFLWHSLIAYQEPQHSNIISSNFILNFGSLRQLSDICSVLWAGGSQMTFSNSILKTSNNLWRKRESGLL